MGGFFAALGFAIIALFIGFAAGGGMMNDLWREDFCASVGGSAASISDKPVCIANDQVLPGYPEWRQ